MIAIAVVNTKGGVGKTTLTAALAVEAVKESGRVALVDLDPQKSLTEWWKKRGSPDNLAIFDNAISAADRVAELADQGFDWVFLDSPPAFLRTIDDCVGCADLVIIPLKPSMLDLFSTQDAVAIASEAGRPFLCVLNDVGQRENSTIGKEARNTLFTYEVPVAETVMINRVKHVGAMSAGKTASEVRAKENKAADEIARLWVEVKAAVAEAKTEATADA